MIGQALACAARRRTRRVKLASLDQRDASAHQRHLIGGAAREPLCGSRLARIAGGARLQRREFARKQPPRRTIGFCRSWITGNQIAALADQRILDTRREGAQPFLQLERLHHPSVGTLLGAEEKQSARHCGADQGQPGDQGDAADICSLQGHALCFAQRAKKRKQIRNRNHRGIR